MSNALLLACDMDRTLLPNGPEPLSEGALDAFRALASSEQITLAYITGRDITLIDAAIEEFKVPVPAFAVGDVGTTMYRRETNEWVLVSEWQEKLAHDWNGLTGADIHALIKDIAGLTEQEATKQGTYKQSYYIESGADSATIRQAAEALLKTAGVQANIVTSFDQTAQRGLLDVLPASANKAYALQYLQQMNTLEHNQIMFAGDSGNDIDALVSGYHAILVANALPEVREEVQRLAREKGIEKEVYFARGGYKGMNGNYAAGILEGVDFFAQSGAIRQA